MLTDNPLAKTEAAFRGVLRRKNSENMQQIYRRTRMSNYDFNKVAKQLY